MVLAHFTACRHIVVRQSGEFHGRPGLDDRCRGSPDYRGTRRHRLAWLLSVAGDSHQVALCGAMIGFAFFNRPVAKLFLGDVGSLPIGVLLGWLLLVLARSSGRVAALLLPLYYLADSTITLLRRAANRETVWQAHRSHFYQRATDGGFRVIDVVLECLS